MFITFRYNRSLIIGFLIEIIGDNWSVTPRKFLRYNLCMAVLRCNVALEVGTKWMLLANISISTKHRYTKWEIN